MINAINLLKDETSLVSDNIQNDEIEEIDYGFMKMKM